MFGMGGSDRGISSSWRRVFDIEFIASQDGFQMSQKRGSVFFCPEVYIHGM
jgi:hypothetical protein